MPGRATSMSTMRRSSVKVLKSRVHTRSLPAAPSVDGERGHRTAYVPLKHDSEKIADGWERRGRKPGAGAANGVSRPSVDKLMGTIGPHATKAYLYKIAKRLAIKNRAAMTRKQLVEAIEETLMRARDETILRQRAG
jgi:hypothetical protein